MIKNLLFSTILALGFNINLSAYDTFDKEEIWTVKTDSDFQDSYLNLKNEIIHNGFVIVHELDLAKSTGKVAEAFEKEAVFKKAKNLMICKSSLTLQMHEENIENVTYCPMVISVYEYDNKSYISYRKYHKYKDLDNISDTINSLLKETIIKSLD